METAIETVIQPEKKEDSITEVEGLRMMVVRERIEKQKAIQENIELALAAAKTEVAKSQTEFDTLRKAMVAKYEMSDKDTFNIIDGKIHRAPLPA